MSDQKINILETKEALTSMFSVSLDVARILKEGSKNKDIAELAAAFFIDNELKTNVLKAADSIKKIPHDLKNVSFSEGLDLIEIASDYIKSFVKIFEENIADKG